MASQYHSLFTAQGLELLREAIQNGTKLGITHMSYGDGNGILPIPDASFTAMVNEVYRTQLNRLAPSKENPNWLEADGVIPSAVGGFNIREVGLWAGNVMVAYANYPPTYKPSADQGTAQIKTIRIVLQIDNTANFELKIDASVVMATIQAVEDAKSIAKKYADETKVHIVDSISELINTEKWNGRTVYVKSYHADFGTRGQIGGGQFIYNESLATKNDGGLVINGWVRVKTGHYIIPEWFGARGDAVTDDYDALKKCFESMQALPDTIYDANQMQWGAKSTTFMLDSVIYRHTKPLRLPAMSDVLSCGPINYFATPNLLTTNNRPTFFYDGEDLEVAAVFLPMYLNNGNGTWSLNKNSTYVSGAGDAAERSLAVGCNYRFNIITKRNTKIGLNAFGFESGTAEIGVGTMGKYSSNQTAASAKQSQDYDYTDLSPRVGIYVRRAWNSKFIRPRIIAHNTGMFIGPGTAKVVIDTPYINRQLDKHTDAIGLTLDYLPAGIPASKSTTSAFVFESADAHLLDPVTEHWGIPYVIANSNVRIEKPHIEGSNLIMLHDFVIYNCKVTVNDWSGIRTMYGLDNTSIVYSCGMDHFLGHFFSLKGASYYSDNSGYNLVDGTGYDQHYNSYFLSVENIPRDKLMGNIFFKDSRYIKEVKGLRDGFYDIYIDETKIKNGFGVSYDTALKSLKDLDEAIRLLGAAWSGIITLRSDLNITQDTGINQKSLAVTFNLNGFSIIANGAAFLINGNVQLTFIGIGTLKAVSTNLFRTNAATLPYRIELSFKDGIAFDTTNYIYEMLQDYVNMTMRIQNSNLTNAAGKYVRSNGLSLGPISLFVKSATRNKTFDTSPLDSSNISNLFTTYKMLD